MKPILLILLVAFSESAMACDNELGIGGYGKLGSSQAIGETTKISKDVVSIDSSFVDRLLDNPTGEELNKNKYELYYLISIGDNKALKAGLYTLLDLLKNPKFITECDTKVQIYGIRELAFSISRNPAIVNEICTLNPDDWELVVQYYTKNTELWGIGYDLPLLEEGYKSWCH